MACRASTSATASRYNRTACEWACSMACRARTKKGAVGISHALLSGETGVAMALARRYVSMSGHN